MIGRAVAVAVAACVLVCVSGCHRPEVIRSDLPGASLVALNKLPHSPENGALDEYCEGYRAQKLGALGRQVAALGWIVTSEATLGRHQVVTFASGFDSGTSGVCSARNANIAVFDGSRLVALAFTPRSNKSWKLGVVEALEGDALLILDGDGPGPPVGELRRDKTGLLLTKVASQSTECDGRAVVPNVYGRPIDTARKALIAQGWKPMPSKGSEGVDLEGSLVRRGVIEVDSCSGTGYGFCGFNYRGPVGDLSVTTMGGPDIEDNVVIGVGVTCRSG